MWTRTRTQLGIPLLGRTVGRASEVITHTEAGADMPASATVAQEVARIRAIDAFHRRLGWGGFGYNAAVCQSGRVYEGRGAGRSGAHTQGQNHKPAIVVLGHGDRTAMSPAALAAHRAVQAHWIRQGHLSPRPAVTGHRDYAKKSCPGNRIYPQLPLLRGVTDVTAPLNPEDDMPLNQDDIRDIAEAVWNRSLVNPASGTSQQAFRRLVDIQARAGAIQAAIDPAKLAKAIIAGLPKGGIDEAAVERALRRVFASLG